MGSSKLEKIYAVCAVLILGMFLGSTTVYYFQYHNMLNGDFVNGKILAPQKINWVKLYPFGESIGPELPENTPDAYTIMGGGISVLKEKYRSFIKSIKGRIDRYTSEKIFALEQLTIVANDIKQRIHWGDIVHRNDSIVVEMLNGYLTRVPSAVSEKEINEIADSIADFVNFLSGEGIGFIYANAGYKVNPQDPQLSEYWLQHEFANKNSDRLMQSLQGRNVNTIDFRTEMLNAGLDWYGAYYISDHHWTNITQLWAAGVIADKLNKDYGFHFDLSYFDKNNYDCTVYEKIFLGSHGRAKANLRYLENYEIALPRSDMKFEVDIPTKKIHRAGEYKDILVDLELLEQIKHYSKSDFLSKPGAYEISQTGNYPKLVILNKKRTNNEGRKILLLPDSFCSYLTGYLAMDVPEIHSVHLPFFDGSIRTYVKATRPDVVILMYYAGNIKPIDWHSHTSPFDLR